MTPLSAFLPLVMPWAPAAPRPIVLQALRLAARELCVEGRIWRKLITTAVSTRVVSLLDQVAPDTIVAIQMAHLNGTKLTPRNFDDLPADYLTAAEANPEWISQGEMDSVILYPFQPGTLETSLYLAPAAGTLYGEAQEAQNTVQDFLFRDHAETISHGALGRILIVPGQDYSNPELAGFYKSQFKDACSTALAASLKGQMRAPQRTKTMWM